jgi:hypothetical protein
MKELEPFLVFKIDQTRGMKSDPLVICFQMFFNDLNEEFNELQNLYRCIDSPLRNCCLGSI